MLLQLALKVRKNRTIFWRNVLPQKFDPYMPTAGKDTLFVDVLAELSNLFSDIYESSPDSVILIGGDLNNSAKNKPRYSLWNHFLDQYQVAQIEVIKPTYHHHIGDGVFDSFLDSALLINPPQNFSISLTQQLCPLSTHILDSKHDALMVRLECLFCKNLHLMCLKPLPLILPP